jgi:hypothetical protein
MSTEAAEARSAHIRAVSVTTVATLAGVLAAVLSGAFASGAGDPLALAILVGIILVQFPAMKLVGITEEYSTKDKLFVTFMSFCLWFVTWGILLTTETQPF